MLAAEHYVRQPLRPNYVTDFEERTRNLKHPNSSFPLVKAKAAVIENKAPRAAA